ncbi:helix-turn-helix transcriptional regulator [Microvirga aerilata]|uniref:Helix-turn-helix transcriptional regulator n=1 Tax=Microvirga aerilata TaxID=670292 RepID=A0A936ZA77_9HYPH|nr:helix-turn-helix transcriptional regulator [Microvirga aerilata]
MQHATFLLGRELRAARRSRKLTQESLAERAGLNLATIANLECGRRHGCTVACCSCCLRAPVRWTRQQC